MADASIRLPKMAHCARMFFTVAKKNGNEKPSFCIVNAQSVKNADISKEKGYDACKRVSGIKRHLVANNQGLPHAISITAANVTDRAGVLKALSREKEALSSVRCLLVDAGYTRERFASEAQQLIQASVEAVKRSELHKFVALPKRWVVERSFAWLDKCRRLWKNCERKLNISLQFVNLAFIRLLLKRS